MHNMKYDVLFIMGITVEMSKHWFQYLQAQSSY